jgi:uncharacterized protein (TIGR03437 family)
MKKLVGYFIVLSATLLGQAPVSPDINPLPTRQFGHPQLLPTPTQNTPNYVDGHEFYNPGQLAFDSSGNLYVIDSFNNRVLGFKSTSLTTGHIADVVLGQQDMQSTLPEGYPNGAFTTGLTFPSGLAVDSKGNVYVSDAGNNRIVRFPAPFSQTSTPLQPDLVIGQKTFSSGNSPNLGQGGNCSAGGLFFAANNQTLYAGLAFDPSGNLWTADPGNNRVLMYAAGSLTAGAQPAASAVIGQNSFTSCSGPQSPNNVQTNLNVVVQPASLAFDSSGNLYIADNFSRVLYYPAGFGPQGQAASRVLGVVPVPAQGAPTPVYPNQYSLGILVNNGFIPPTGIFIGANHLYVADTPANRIVEYDLPANWPPATATTPSPQILTVIGQTGLNGGQANQNQPQPSAYTLEGPNGGAFSGSQLWVADSGNSRVLGYSLSGGAYSGASIVLGQIAFTYNAINLIEGREVFLVATQNALSASAMVVDNSSSPPHLYVADPGNNRILCFKNALVVGASTPPATADMVIGQPDLFTSEVNYPLGNAQTPTQTGLNNPIGVVVDNNGNLYVADSGNGRVLRFPAPFNNVPANETASPANLVLGQSSFTTLIQTADANSMHTPWGLALFAGGSNATPLAGGLAVSDTVFNRVLIFPKESGGDFVNGESATLVFGQPNFTSVIQGPGQASFNNPRGIASDTSDRLYVADAGNNRIMEFIQAPENLSNGPTASNILNSGTFGGFNQPQAVAINSTTTELWVADTNSGRLLRFPEYITCQTISCAPTAGVSTAPALPIGVALDSSGNVIVGDTFNRLTLFFGEAFYKNGASYSAQTPLAPGMLLILGRLGLPFSIGAGAAQSLPWPTTLANVQVTVTWPGGPTNGTLAPIFATNASFGAIYFQVPGEAPTSGSATFIVTNATTNAILGVGQFQMAKADPAFLTANESGSGPVAALNVSSSGVFSVNTAANPAPRGSTIVLYLTGQGQVSGGPPTDGAAPPALMTPVLPTLLIDAIPVTPGYSGLGGGYPGLWQINATVPQGAVPNSANSVALSYLGFGSTIAGNPLSGSDGTPGPDVHPILTTIWVGN